MEWEERKNRVGEETGEWKGRRRRPNKRGRGEEGVDGEWKSRGDGRGSEEEGRGKGGREGRKKETYQERRGGRREWKRRGY